MKLSRVAKTCAMIAALLVLSASYCQRHQGGEIVRFEWDGHIWEGKYDKNGESIIEFYPPGGGKLTREMVPFTLQYKDGDYVPVPRTTPGTTAKSPARGASEPHFVYLLDGGFQSEKIVIFQQETGKYVTHLAVPQRPQGVVISPDGRLLYVTHLELGRESVPSPPAPPRISVIDTAARTIVQTINLDAGVSPRKPAISPDGRWLYIPNNGPSPSIVILDTQSRTVAGIIPLPTVADRVVISPDGAILYAVPTQTIPTRLLAIDTATREVFSNSAVSLSLRNILVNFTGTRLYLTSVDTIIVYDTAALTELTRIRIPGTPRINMLIQSFDSGSLFANHEFDGTLTRIDTLTNQVIETIGTGQAVDSSFAMMVPLGPPPPQ